MKKTICLPIIFLVFFFFNTSANVIAASDTNEINIATSPHKVLFDIDNIKPGDWAKRDLIVENKGKQDFKYTASIQLRSGSKQLFNALKLKVSDKDGSLYSGKLANFDRLEYRKLAKADKETLNFQVDFPNDLGNEYQGLKCEFTIKLYVEGTLGGLLPADKNFMQNTGTNLVAGGIMMILGGGSLYLFKRKIIAKIKQT
ncbi:TasA family protein [Bacillus sp. FJAT-49736]|uniref:TasA family protein n=1 Tax=Bacillus sp. FJAT-49736 TaxID=2833582 RepID=UPI001BCA415C|nr:TasA family protein [Bacillus sp. FJAT-49736]MBS4173357.1 cell wall protein [Bacillus sp. FJAT-49736]